MQHDYRAQRAAPTCARVAEASLRATHGPEDSLAVRPPPADRPPGRLLRPLAQPLSLAGERPVGERAWNYYAIVNALAAEARQQNGHIDNVASAGSVENISRLVASRTSCDVHFALVQDGMSWPADHALELIGRLGKAESLVFLGRDADRIKALTDLRGMRIGIGPIGSGTERAARQYSRRSRSSTSPCRRRTGRAARQARARGARPWSPGHR